MSNSIPANTVTSAHIYAVNPSAAAFSKFPTVNMCSQYVPKVVCTVRNQKKLSGHETSQTTVFIRYNVPEICMKDVMSCEISSLGYHLSMSVKEKIWKGEFIDILSLLPFHKDFSIKSDRRGERRVRMIGAGQYSGHSTIGCRQCCILA